MLLHAGSTCAGDNAARQCCVYSLRRYHYGHKKKNNNNNKFNADLNLQRSAFSKHAVWLFGNVM